MPGVERQGDPATCGHPNTGSSNVWVNGRGCTRVFADSAGGTILGPGIPSVIVNGVPISVIGDAIAPHGDPPHSPAPTTANPSNNVVAGDGV